MKRVFKVKEKVFFIIFKGLSVVKSYLGNTLAKQPPKTQQKPLHITSAIASAYLGGQYIAACENQGN